MQQVIRLVEKLRASGIEVPVFPQIAAPASLTGAVRGQGPTDAERESDAAFVARIETWREQVRQLYRENFGDEAA